MDGGKEESGDLRRRPVPHHLGERDLLPRRCPEVLPDPPLVLAHVEVEALDAVQTEAAVVAGAAVDAVVVFAEAVQVEGAGRRGAILVVGLCKGQGQSQYLVNLTS